MISLNDRMVLMLMLSCHWRGSVFEFVCLNLSDIYLSTHYPLIYNKIVRRQSDICEKYGDLIFEERNALGLVL